MHDFQSWGKTFSKCTIKDCVFFFWCVVCVSSALRGGKKKKSLELDGDFHESITAKFHTELPGEVAKSPRVKF